MVFQIKKHPLKKFPLPGFPPVDKAFQAECDEVGTALWSHVRVVIVDPPPDARLTPPPNVTVGALGLYANEAYL